jgi:small subunit ribosomal protein S20
MANHESALKRARQNIKRAAHNVDRMSRTKTFVKKFTSGLKTNNAAALFTTAQSEVQKSVSRGVLHRNTASRKISRLNKMLKSAEQQ